MIPKEDGYYWAKFANWEVARIVTDVYFKGIRTIYLMEETPKRWSWDIVEWGPKIEEPV